MKSKHGTLTPTASGVAAIKKELIRPDWQSNTGDVVPWSLNKSLCPWCLWHIENVTCPWHIENVHTGAHPVGRVHKHCRSVWQGCLRLPFSIGVAVLPGWVFLLGKSGLWLSFPPGNTLDCLNTILPMSPDGKWAESSPSSTGTVHIHSLWW